MTALQKGCDQDDLAVNTTNTFRGDAAACPPDRFVGAPARIGARGAVDSD
jgi:hypothetical protein